MMKITISGASGFIGTALTEWFSQSHFRVSTLSRKSSPSDTRFRTLFWDPYHHTMDTSQLEGEDVLIHLSGENIAAHRWSNRIKKVIRESRIVPTLFLSETLTNLKSPPKLFICASAAGYYGNHNPQDKLTEQSSPGLGFLANVVQDWEQATEPASRKGIRVVHLRTGMVLGPQGGALKQLLPFFKLGLGGKIGDGKQMMSWIARDEIPRIIYHIIMHPELSGPLNLTSPFPVSNEFFTHALGKALHRPVFFRLPAFLITALLCELEKELLLSGAQILPQKLIDSGYQFLFPTIESTFQHIVSQPY